jgi:hypothetical protein
MCLTMHVTDACLRARVALTQDKYKYATALGHNQPHRGSHLATASLFIATLSIRHPVYACCLPAVTQAADGQLLAAACCRLISKSGSVWLCCCFLPLALKYWAAGRQASAVDS